MRHLLLVLSLVIALGCTSNMGKADQDPVSQLLARRYIKSTDFFGAHEIKSVLQVESTSDRDSSEKSLYETLRVDGTGGYHVQRREREGEAPWELVVVGSSYYVVTPDGRVETLQPGMLGQTTRERVAESWRTVLEPFRQALKLEQVGERSVGGRAATEWSIVFVAEDAGEGDVVPLEAAGVVAVDKESGFPLHLKFSGVYERRSADKPVVKVTVQAFEFGVMPKADMKPVRPPRQAAPKDEPKAEARGTGPRKGR